MVKRQTALKIRKAHGYMLSHLEVDNINKIEPLEHIMNIEEGLYRLMKSHIKQMKASKLMWP